METTKPRISWHPIEPLRSADVPPNGAFAALSALRNEWERFLSTLQEIERVKIRQRSLRRLAIETGILERLYDIDWGLTLTLVAEGFARDVIERDGGRLDDRTTATLVAQRDSLQMVLDFVDSGRNLSPGFIKELHAAITRTQDTYTVTDSLGRVTEARLTHGEWKTQPNHVELEDGRVLEYAPPEQVGSEIDRLISMFGDLETQAVHPIVSAAWLHHRFVQIHPFADGNGRVGRALVLLVLQKHHFAPLVVDRFHRDDYLAALTAANAGDLAPLVKLFTRLESSALASELESPQAELSVSASTEVAHTLAAQLHAERQKRQLKIEKELHVRTKVVAARIRHWFESKRDELWNTFKQQGLDDAHIFQDFQIGADIPTRGPGAVEQRDSLAPNPLWFRYQITKAARLAGHYADFGPDSGWCGLRIRLGGVQVRYVAALHGAGQKTGVLAVVTFGELGPINVGDEDAEKRLDRQQIVTGRDAFRVVHTEAVSAIEDRASELEDLLDEGLSVALVELFRAAR